MTEPRHYQTDRTEYIVSNDKVFCRTGQTPFWVNILDPDVPGGAEVGKLIRQYDELSRAHLAKAIFADRCVTTNLVILGLLVIPAFIWMWAAWALVLGIICQVVLAGMFHNGLRDLNADIAQWKAKVNALGPVGPLAPNASPSGVCGQHSGAQGATGGQGGVGMGSSYDKPCRYDFGGEEENR